MGRKTLILREDQFNEICGANVSYLDNDSDYAEDGTKETHIDGAVSDAGGGSEYYGKPTTTDDYADSLAPETLWALLFRNGGNGLWGHWGSGLRARELTEDIDEWGDDAADMSGMEDGYDGPTNDPEGFDEVVYYKAREIMRKFGFEDTDGFVRDKKVDALEYVMDTYMDYYAGDAKIREMDADEVAKLMAREAMKIIDREYYDEEVEPFFYLDEGKKKLQESNSELEGRSWNGVSYTNLTTKKTELKKLLTKLVQQNAPEKQIRRVKSSLAAICNILDRETGAIKGRKTTMKNLGFANQFQKAGGTKNNGNGKAHSKKTKDPNVGTGYITYA